jgi:hypothetical protein
MGDNFDLMSDGKYLARGVSYDVAVAEGARLFPEATVEERSFGAALCVGCATVAVVSSLSYNRASQRRLATEEGQ